MSHARTQIRQAMKTALTGLPSTGSNVFAARVYPLTDANLPALSINTDREDVLEDEQSGDLEFRAYMVQVEVTAKATTAIDDVQDQACAEVEAALAADTTLGGLVKHVEYVDMDFEDSDGLDQPVGVATMRWRVLYRVDAADPETLIQ